MKDRKYPWWTYKQPMKNVPSKLPKNRNQTTKQFVKEFDKLNGLIHA